MADISNLRFLLYKAVSMLDKADHKFQGLLSTQVGRVRPRHLAEKTLDTCYDLRKCFSAIKDSQAPLYSITLLDGPSFDIQSIEEIERLIKDCVEGYAIKEGDRMVDQTRSQLKNLWDAIISSSLREVSDLNQELHRMLGSADNANHERETEPPFQDFITRTIGLLRSNLENRQRYHKALTSQSVSSKPPLKIPDRHTLGDKTSQRDRGKSNTSKNTLKRALVTANFAVELDGRGERNEAIIWYEKCNVLLDEVVNLSTNFEDTPKLRSIQGIYNKRILELKDGQKSIQDNDSAMNTRAKPPALPTKTDQRMTNSERLPDAPSDWDNSSAILMEHPPSKSRQPDGTSDHIDPSQSRQCTFCGEQLHNSVELEKHMLRHISPFKCNDPQCDHYTEGFATSGALEKHVVDVHENQQLSVKQSRINHISTALGQLSFQNDSMHQKSGVSDQRPGSLSNRGNALDSMKNLTLADLAMSSTVYTESTSALGSATPSSSSNVERSGYVNASSTDQQPTNASIVLQTGSPSQPTTYIHATCRHCHHWTYGKTWNYSMHLDQNSSVSCERCERKFGLGRRSRRSSLISQNTTKSNNQADQASQEMVSDVNTEYSSDSSLDRSLGLSEGEKIHKSDAHPDEDIQTASEFDLQFQKPSPFLSTSAQTHDDDPHPAVGDDSDSDDQSVISSIASSVFSIAISRASSQSSAVSAVHMELFEECLQAMREHPRFSQICKAAVESINALKFERNLRRFLKFFSCELQQNASEALEIQVARHMKIKAAVVARRVTEFFFDNVEHEGNLHERNQLSEQERPKNRPQTTVNDDGEESDEDENGESEAENNQSSNLPLAFDQVQNFVMKSTAFEKFLERLESFVKRVRSKQYLTLGSCPSCGIDFREHQTTTVHLCERGRRWVCPFTTCSASFAKFETLTEVVAHQAAAHNFKDELYLCESVECSRNGYVWPLLSNFKLHCELVHRDKNLDDLVVHSKRRSLIHQNITNGHADVKDKEETGHLSKVGDEKAQPPINKFGSYNHKYYTQERHAYTFATRIKAHLRNCIDRIVEQPPTPGKRRLYLHCSCGRQVAGDYEELKAGGLNKLQMIFDSMTTQNRQTPCCHPQSPEESEHQSTGSIELTKDKGCSNISTVSTSSTSSITSSFLPYHNDSNELAQSAMARRSSNGQSNYLLLVVPHMRHGNRVEQPVSDWILSDYSFFKALGEQYKLARGRFRSVFSWRSLRALRFVRFEMFPSQLAQIQKLDDLPPPAFRDAYEYEPVEWSPPIHPDHMLHLIEHPDDALRSLELFRCVPKKLREKLEPSPVRGRCSGWGIQYIEDVDQERVCFVAFLSALMSLTLAVAWAICKRDVQGGFAVGGTTFVILTTGIGSLERLCRTR